MKYNCSICGIEISSPGMCPSCGSSVKEVGNSMPNLEPMIYNSNLEDRKDLRKFIAEADPLTDVSQVTDEIKRAAQAVKGAPAALRRARLSFLQRRKAGLEKRQERGQYKWSGREAKHSYKTKLHSLKSKRAGMYKSTYEEYDDEDSSFSIPYRARKRQLKRQYKLGKLQRKIDYLQRRSEYD